MKELVHAFSCEYIELWMHLGRLESTQEARVALGYRLEQLLKARLHRRFLRRFKRRFLRRYLWRFQVARVN